MSRHARVLSPPLRPRLRGWIHGVAAPIAVVVAVLLWRSASPGASRISAAVFGICLVGLYTISAAYHLPRWSAPLRRLLARMDVAMIQVFIAATFTPIAVHALSGPWRTWALVVTWSIAVIGAGIAVSPAKGPRWLNVAAYASFGALAAIPLVKLSPELDPAALVLFGLGGLIYILGGVFYALQRPNLWPDWFGFHEAFHVMVVIASAAHVAAIWRYVLPLA